MATRNKKEAPRKGSTTGTPGVKESWKSRKVDDRAGAEDEDLGDQGPYAGRDACSGCAPPHTDY